MDTSCTWLVGVCGAELAAGLAERRLVLAHRAELTRALARGCCVLARGTERALGRACGGVGSRGACTTAGGVGVGLLCASRTQLAAGNRACTPACALALNHLYRRAAELESRVLGRGAAEASCRTFTTWPHVLPTTFPASSETTSIVPERPWIAINFFRWRQVFASRASLALGAILAIPS